MAPLPRVLPPALVAGGWEAGQTGCSLTAVVRALLHPGCRLWQQRVWIIALLAGAALLLPQQQQQQQHGYHHRRHRCRSPLPHPPSLRCQPSWRWSGLRAGTG